MPTSLTGRVSEVLRLDAAYIHSQHVHLLNLLGRRLPSLDQPDHMQAIRLVHIRLATGDGLVVTRPQSPAPLPFASARGASGLPVNLEIHSVRSMRFIVRQPVWRMLASLAQTVFLAIGHLFPIVRGCF